MARLFFFFAYILAWLLLRLVQYVHKTQTCHVPKGSDHVLYTYLQVDSSCTEFKNFQMQYTEIAKVQMHQTCPIDFVRKKLFETTGYKSTSVLCQPVLHFQEGNAFCSAGSAICKISQRNKLRIKMHGDSRF